MHNLDICVQFVLVVFAFISHVLEVCMCPLFWPSLDIAILEKIKPGPAGL